MKRKAKIYYSSLDDFWRKEEKLNWLRDNPIEKIEFERLEPDAKHNWINQTDNDFETLLPLIDKDVKAGKSDEAIFGLFTLGVATNRDDWVYSFSKTKLQERMSYFSTTYYKLLKSKNTDFPSIIKWSRDLKDKFIQGKSIDYEKTPIVKALYRPYVSKFFFANKLTADVFTQNHASIFGDKFNNENYCIGFIGKDTVIPFSILAFKHINDLNGLSNAAGGTKTLPLYTFDSENQKHENITDWALNQFRDHYAKQSEPSAVADGLTRKTQKTKNKAQDKDTSVPIDDSTAELKPSATADGSDRNELKSSAIADGSDTTNGFQITKEDIFHYVYAVLHSPVYRKKYEQNLKREFPRIPFYDDFFQWAKWGAELMDLHINYETQKPFALERNDLRKKPKQPGMFASEGDNAFEAKPQTKLRALKDEGAILIDSITTLSGVPPPAWEYKLGNRSAIEWILDQYKEKTPQDATIREKFNTYRFADYKEQVIDLLKKVTNVSVKTMEIVNSMPHDIQSNENF